MSLSDNQCECSCHATGADHIIPCCFNCTACGADRITDPEAHKEVCIATVAPAEKEAANNPKLERELVRLLNRYSAENGSNTPDFILAEFLMNCLRAWNLGVRSREEWYGRGEHTTNNHQGL